MIPNPANPQSWNRYAYAYNNPLYYTDPSGHVAIQPNDDGHDACLDPIDCVYPETWEGVSKRGTGIVDTLSQEQIEENRAAAINTVAAIPGIDFFDDVSIAFTGYSLAGQAGYEEKMGWGWRAFSVAATFLPVGTSAAKNTTEAALDIARKMGDNIPVGQGFKSFYQFKKHLGGAGENMDWHHIVEKSQIRKSGFSPYSIHNTGNMIAVDATTHRKISGHYSSLELTTGKRVRDWLSGQSFEFQYQYGVEILIRYGVIE